MYCIHYLWIILCFGFTIKANHFRGGTITWKPINNNISAGGTVSIMITQTYSWTWSQIGCNTSMIATQWPSIDTGTKAGSGSSLMCNASCSTSGGYVGNEVPIIGYCTDFSNALDLTVSQRSDVVNLTVGAYFTATFSAGGGWQTLALGNSSGWSLSTIVDLRVRSDNGLINTPPVATCISYISVPINVQQTIQIPVLDADNDFLRCRFANGPTECANACPPGSLPSGTSLSSSCLLTITGPTAGAYYLVAVQVEDFISNTSTTPLSSVPLQFLIYVYDTQNCTLKPLLISNLNSSSCQGAQVGASFTIIFTVINQCGSDRTMSDIATLSFPIISKSALIQNTTNTSLWSMKITWTPTVSQVGSQVFCAVAADSANVQSDQYCVTIFVGFSSIPLCPGVTIASTTTTTTTTAKQTTTTTTVTTSSTTSITTSISSTLLSSTVKPADTINWPLILGLCLGVLALGVSCLLCCWYFLLGRGASRRRREKDKSLETNIEWLQQKKNPNQNFSKGITDSQTSKSFIITKFNQGSATFKQSSKTPVDRLNSSKSCFSVQKIDRQNKIPQSLTLNKMSEENIARMPSTIQDWNDLLTTRPFSSTKIRTKSVNVRKVSGRRNSSINVRAELVKNERIATTSSNIDSS